MGRILEVSRNAMCTSKEMRLKVCMEVMDMDEK